jgi:hypothetical protein
MPNNAPNAVKNLFNFNGLIIFILKYLVRNTDRLFAKKCADLLDANTSQHCRPTQSELFTLLELRSRSSSNGKEGKEGRSSSSQ